MALSRVFRTAVLAAVRSVYVGTFTVAPTASTAGTEVASAGYARTAVTLSAPWVKGSAVAISNETMTLLPTLSADATVVAVGLFSAPTGGTLLAYANLPTSITCRAGELNGVNVGELGITLSEA